jgi:histone deacetylase 6
MLLQEQAALLELNDALQRRARQVMEQRNKGRPAVNRELSRLDGADARYR